MTPKRAGELPRGGARGEAGELELERVIALAAWAMAARAIELERAARRQGWIARDDAGAPESVGVPFRAEVPVATPPSRHFNTDFRPPQTDLESHRRTE